MKTETQYSSDLTNRQWQLIRQLLPRRSRLGRRPIDRRQIINAILYVVRTGCQVVSHPPTLRPRSPKTVPTNQSLSRWATALAALVAASHLAAAQ